MICAVWLFDLLLILQHGIILMEMHRGLLLWQGSWCIKCSCVCDMNGRTFCIFSVTVSYKHRLTWTVFRLPSKSLYKNHFLLSFDVFSSFHTTSTIFRNLGTQIERDHFIDYEYARAGNYWDFWAEQCNSVKCFATQAWSRQHTVCEHDFTGSDCRRLQNTVSEFWECDRLRGDTFR